MPGADTLKRCTAESNRAYIRELLQIKDPEYAQVLAEAEKALRHCPVHG